MSHNRYSVRVRLTIWYTIVLAIISLSFSLGIYAFFRSSLLEQLDHQLVADCTTIDTLLREDPGELEEIEEFRAIHLFKVIENGAVLHVTHEWQVDQLDKAIKNDYLNYILTWESPEDKPFRIRISQLKIQNYTYRVFVARHAKTYYDSLRILGLILILGLPCLLIFAVIGGYFLAGRVLSPIGAMAEKARQITAERLSERLPVDNPYDEFGRLAIVFNKALTRLQDSFDRLKSFTADASHELRMPLTALRSVGEVGLRDNKDLDSCRNVIGSMLEEADRLSTLVNQLLTLTRFDSGKNKLECVDIVSLVNDVVECLHVLAEEKGQALSVEGADKMLNIRANPVAIRQALINLLDNAIKYTPQNGNIRVVIKQTTREVVIEVVDNGPGISPEHHGNIFDRFYRIEKDRSTEQGGTGLGLAITRRAVELNGGKVELDSEVGKGSIFRIILPVPKGGDTE